jgi:signal transduction histidine kinase
MTSKSQVLSHQLQLISLLVVGVAGVMLILNLTYIASIHLQKVESQIKLKQTEISLAIENALKREKDTPPTRVIASDPNIQATVKDALDKLEIAKYIAIIDESNTPLVAVSIGQADPSTSSEFDIQSLREHNIFLQTLSLLWGQANYYYSFPIIVGHKDTGKNINVDVRFVIPAYNLRSLFSDLLIANIILFFTGIIASLIIASYSADILIKPMEALSNQLEKLEKGEIPAQEEQEESGARIMPPSLKVKLQLLGDRLAGERNELEITKGQLTQIIGKIEERLLMLNPDKQVVLMSPKVDHLLGVAGIDLVGAKLDDRLGSVHPLIELVNRVNQSHSSVENVMLINQMGEQPRQILASAQYIEDKSGPIGTLVSLRDFDSFRQFQSQLDYSDRLAALGRITSGVAHEVKNPLNAMVIHLEILRAKLVQPGADITPQLDILSSEIKRLDRVVQTFLNFTRPVKVNLVPIDLNDLVHQITRLAAAEAAANKVDILEELSPEFLRVNGDADLLKQALLNIIINGCQAMPRGGPLSIKTKRLGSYAVLTIADRGVGIPPEVKDKIFQLYYTTKSTGNGIGLAHAFRTIQLHNGRIEFESTTDVGTTFKISLPEV